MALVFVYGTLMRGRRNHAVLKRLGAAFVGEATTVEPRVLVDLGPYPALLASREGASTRVSGELWSVTRLDELDAFEGCPDLYRRESIAVQTGAPSDEVGAFVYVLAGSPGARARVLPRGRYALDIGAATEDGGDPDVGPGSSVGRAGD